MNRDVIESNVTKNRAHQSFLLQLSQSIDTPGSTTVDFRGGNRPVSPETIESISGAEFFPFRTSGLRSHNVNPHSSLNSPVYSALKNYEQTNIKVMDDFIRPQS